MWLRLFEFIGFYFNFGVNSSWKLSKTWFGWQIMWTACSDWALWVCRDGVMLVMQQKLARCSIRWFKLTVGFRENFVTCFYSVRRIHHNIAHVCCRLGLGIFLSASNSNWLKIDRFFAIQIPNEPKDNSGNFSTRFVESQSGTRNAWIIRLKIGGVKNNRLIVQIVKLNLRGRKRRTVNVRFESDQSPIKQTK